MSKALSSSRLEVWDCPPLLNSFNALAETLYLLSNPANAEHIQESIAQANAGQKLVKELIEE